MKKNIKPRAKHKTSCQGEKKTNPSHLTPGELILLSKPFHKKKKKKSGDLNVPMNKRGHFKLLFIRNQSKHP
jgi:hypothetical protein